MMVYTPGNVQGSGWYQYSPDAFPPSPPQPQHPDEEVLIDFPEPAVATQADIDRAQEKINDIRIEVSRVNAQLDLKSGPEHEDWRIRAKTWRGHRLVEVAILQAWVQQAVRLAVREARTARRRHAGYEDEPGVILNCYRALAKVQQCGVELPEDVTKAVDTVSTNVRAWLDRRTTEGIIGG
jgi:hypothetical protein